MKSRAVLFDLDGTLIDTTAVYFKMVDLTLDRLGFPAVPRDAVLADAERVLFDWLRIIPTAFHDQSDSLLPAAWRIIAEFYPVLFREEATVIPGAVEVMTGASKSASSLPLPAGTWITSCACLTAWRQGN